MVLSGGGYDDDDDDDDDDDEQIKNKSMFGELWIYVKVLDEEWHFLVRVRGANGAQWGPWGKVPGHWPRPPPRWGAQGAQGIGTWPLAPLPQGLR